MISMPNDHQSNDFRDTFIKIFMEDLKLKVRQQHIYQVEMLSSKNPRRSAFVIIRSYSDFRAFFNKLVPTNFFYNGYFMIALISDTFLEIQDIFSDLWKLQIYNVIVIVEDGHERLSIFTFFPFRSSADCMNTTPVLINEFINGSFTRGLSNIFPNKMKNLQQCEVKVATSNDIPPHMVLRAMSDGTFNIFGRDFEIIDALSKSLNFKINFNYIGQYGCILEIRGIEGALKKVYENKSDLVIADCWLRINRMEMFDTSTTYFTDKIVMAFPPIPELTSFEKLFYPLSLTIWILLGLYLWVGISTIFIIKKKSKVVQNFVIGENVNYPYFNMLIGILGLQQNRLPGNNFARFLLMNFLILCLVMRTVYQGKLFQILQANMKHSEPQTLAEMQQLGYKFHAVEFYEELISSSLKMNIVSNGKYRFESTIRLLKENDKNGILEVYSDLLYQYNIKNLTNIQVCREHFLLIPIVIYAKKNFFLMQAINEKIEILRAAGLIEYWFLLSLSKEFENKMPNHPKVLTFDHLSGCFYIWIFGCSLSILALVFELMIEKLKTWIKRTEL
ncbi:unnamed protein product [Chironomus riparius]|uniref:Putative ionotropic receptor ligand binding domain-containing protein n=1 Tax=Chironomus riparius TaxID=315576 RepID=A0A9N9S7L3_9DIPT|nr:unnamed protein product [Chironomus riparius]